MTKQEIDKAAYKGTEISSPKIADEIYWLGMYYIYKIVAADNIPSEQAKKIKSKFTKRIESIEQWEEIFIDSLNLMSELDELIAPEAELVNMSRYALIDKIIRFEAILNGTIKKYDGKIPELYHRIYEQLNETEEIENASNT